MEAKQEQIQMSDISFDEVYSKADRLWAKSKVYGRGWPARLLKLKQEAFHKGEYGTDYNMQPMTYTDARRELWVLTLAIQFMRNKI